MSDPAATRPSVSVVICAYTMGRWNELRAAVQSVQAQTSAPGEVIVVVDHAPELQARAQSEFAGVRVIANRFARGLSGARNSGVAVARGEIVAFLDDDARAAPDWLARLCVHYADPSVLGAGGAIEPDWAGSRPRWMPQEFDWVVGCTYRGMPARAGVVRNLIGANMSLRRAAIDACGGFRTEIGRVGSVPVGCEETELCIRARRRYTGSTLRYEPRARVFHHVTAARATWRYFLARCYAEGISKALVARFVGSEDALASERAYTLRTLPLGAFGALADVIRRRDLYGFARAFAIVAGLGATVWGYTHGSLQRRLEPAPIPA